MNCLLLQQLWCIALFLAFARETVAQSHGTHDIQRCFEEMAVGNCREKIQRWYFNNKTGHCESFTYTGCGGNGNNFNTTMYCRHACGAARRYYTKKRCYEEMDVGNCDKQIQRWYYNNRTGTCQPFTYTGCGGNGNNFNSTMYCHHACLNHDHHSGYLAHHSETSEGKQKNQQVAGDGDEYANHRQQLFTTRQPTLIRNQPGSDTQQQQLDRQPVDQRRKRRDLSEFARQGKTNDDLDVGYDAAPEEKFAGQPARWKNLKARRHGARRLAADQYAVDEYGDEYSFYNNDDWTDAVGNRFRMRGRVRGGVNLMSELLVRMQQTVDLLERFVAATTANRRRTPLRRRRPTPKNAGEERPTLTEAESGSSRRPGKSVRRHGGRDQRLRQLALLGRLDRLPAGFVDRRARKPEIVAAEKSQVAASQKKTEVKNDGVGAELERQQQRHEVETPQTAGRNEDREDGDNDDDIEVMSDRIRAIIADPESSFSYENISPEDLVSLEEMMSQSSAYGTMKLVEKDDDEVDEEAAEKNDGSTAATPTTKVAADDVAKPAEQAAEVVSLSESSRAVNSDLPKTF